MSALRRLWAAAWLRWQLVRAWLRRDRGKAAQGYDFHLADSEVPREGVDYDSAELPAELIEGLEATRTALRDRETPGPRSVAPTRSRRLRTAALAAVTVVGLGVFGAGATALVTGSTGVPAVDRLLGQEAAQQAEEGKGGSALPPGALSPEPGTDSMSLTVPFEADGITRRITSTSYRGEYGRICSVTSTGDVDTADPRAGVSCGPLSPLSRKLDEQAVVVAAIKADEGIVIDGFTVADVEQIELTGPSGEPLVVRLSAPWQPDGPDGLTLKSFLAVGANAFKQDDQRAIVRATDPREYSIRARLTSGKTVRIVPSAP
jgi:hypothetical protein